MMASLSFRDFGLIIPLKIKFPLCSKLTIPQKREEKSEQTLKKYKINSVELFLRLEWLI